MDCPTHDDASASHRPITHSAVLFAIGLVAAALFAASDAAAHTVGLSQSVFVVRRDGATTADIVFSKSDALVLARIDSNHDGEVSPEELQASVPVFAELVRTGVIVSADGSVSLATSRRRGRGG